jgi:hypothetical protein
MLNILTYIHSIRSLLHHAVITKLIQTEQLQKEAIALSLYPKQVSFQDRVESSLESKVKQICVSHPSLNIYKKNVFIKRNNFE